MRPDADRCAGARCLGSGARWSGVIGGRCLGVQVCFNLKIFPMSEISKHNNLEKALNFKISTDGASN